MRTYIIATFCMQAFALVVNLCSAFDPKKHTDASNTIAILIGAVMLIWAARTLGWF